MNNVVLLSDPIVMMAVRLEGFLAWSLFDR
uniref:Uncharacterized protein n=1 Tax=Rhizophora mucronata TaxID=61149 RepID=A0A2P2PLG4_RHIMU